VQSRDVVHVEHYATRRNAVAVHVVVLVGNHAAGDERLIVLVIDDAEQRLRPELVVLVDAVAVVDCFGHAAFVVVFVGNERIVQRVVVAVLVGQQLVDVEHAEHELERDLDDAERQQQGQVGDADRG
jgi:ribulose 1,5-bisphosphate synthetase/thiazole synthase